MGGAVSTVTPGSRRSAVIYPELPSFMNCTTSTG